MEPRESKKPTVVMDLDGVIHSYTSGWKGETVIPDPPVEGIREAIAELRTTHRVVVVSSRCQSSPGVRAVEEYLEKNGIEVDGVSSKKPPAVVYIDDRAITFTGDTVTLPEQVRKFRTWQEKEENEERQVATTIRAIDDQLQSYRDRWTKYAANHPDVSEETILKAYLNEVKSVTEESREWTSVLGNPRTRGTHKHS